MLCRKATKPQKAITLEDVESSTTIELSPVVHKQQPKAEDIHSHVQDLYPPPVNPYHSISLSVNADNDDDKIVKKVLPEPSLSHAPKPHEASPVASVQVLHLPAPSVASADSTLQSTMATHHNVDSATVTSPIEGRTADAVCLSKEATKDKLKQQTPNKRRKKRVKTTSPKLNSNQDKLELKRPVSDDICSWLQLEDSELNERLQQHVSRPHDHSHDLQAVVSISDSQDIEQSTHHQIALNNSTKECRLSPERKATLHMHSSPITQQKRLSDSETVSSVQSAASKF